jgi:hypothetical protein
MNFRLLKSVMVEELAFIHKMARISLPNTETLNGISPLHLNNDYNIRVRPDGRVIVHAVAQETVFT